MEDIIVSAPGKVILHGEHAVVYGKSAIAASLDLRTFLKLRFLNDNHIQVSLPDIGLSVKWTLSDIIQAIQLPFADPVKPVPCSKELLLKIKSFIGLSDDESDTKHLAAVALLYLYLGITYKDSTLPSVAVHIESALPTSAGLGSSAAYATCLAASFLQFSGYLETPSVVSEASTHSWSDEHLQLVNDWAFQAERIIHGNPSGIDNAVSCYGGALKFQGGRITHLTSVPKPRVLLFNTNVPRSTKVLVAGVRNKYDKFPEIIKPILDSMEAITDKCEVLLRELCENLSEQETYKSLQELVEINQHLLCVIGVSHPALDQICNEVQKHGLHAKLTGAGGGGCAFTLITPGFSSEAVHQIKLGIKDLGFDSWETHIGGSGVSWHSNISQITHKLPESFR